ncbi:hypothetical protein LCGC14_0794150 [marine sediment metagenome]|uniref:Uncharacterized protein n=1 Tax=marine sediment metagenome TaxID=412755 RepID=A0A0F9SYS3_9ZZZZ
MNRLSKINNMDKTDRAYCALNNWFLFLQKNGITRKYQKDVLCILWGRATENGKDTIQADFWEKEFFTLKGYSKY